jgi:hypothetical protein
MVITKFTSQVTGWASVVAYDPGGATGWTVMAVNPKDMLVNTRELHKVVRHFAHGEIGGGEMERTDQLTELCDSWEDAAVVGESFTLAKFSQDDELFSPMRINARVEWFLHGYGRNLFTQTAAMAKSRWTDERLKMCKSLGKPWYIPGPDHQRDAVRHAALFLGRCRDQAALRAKAWPHLFKKDGTLQ